MSASITTQSVAPETRTDQHLVTRYRGGEQRAAAELVDRHGSAIGRFLYGSGAEPDEVEDLVQETFFRAFRRLDTWRGEASFRAWLLSIAGNLLKDQVRGRRNRRLITLDDQAIADTADPHADFATGDLQERLRQELSRLPRLQREVFLLRAQQGSEYAEIALVLGTTAGAARVHYHQAVKRLKELFR